jgi:transcriptional regulator with XRE-family HTH domain
MQMIDSLKKQILIRIKAHGMTLAGLEDKIGVPKGAVTSIINGRSTNPSIKLIRLIAKGLNCSIESFLHKSIEGDKSDTLDYEVLSKCFDAIEGYISKNEMKCNLNTFSYILRESYKYTISNNTNNFDNRFIEWLIAKALSNSKASKTTIGKINVT